MSGCCGYQTLQWYYTYPSNPYRFVQPQTQPVQPFPVQENYTPEYYLNLGYTLTTTNRFPETSLFGEAPPESLRPRYRRDPSMTS